MYSKNERHVLILSIYSFEACLFRSFASAARVRAAENKAEVVALILRIFDSLVQLPQVEQRDHRREDRMGSH